MEWMAQGKIRYKKQRWLKDGSVSSREDAWWLDWSNSKTNIGPEKRARANKGVKHIHQ